MAGRKPLPGHFERGFGKLGWVYVARNDLHREDIYKIGYTEQTPEVRVLGLNTEQRNRTSQIGFFQLIFAAAVLDAQGCEQALFKRIGKLMESSRKEFVNAPVDLIVGELLNIQKKDHARVSATCACLYCGFVVSFCPLPQVKLECPACLEDFQCKPDGAPIHCGANARPVSYFAPGFTPEMRRHSPLAKAFVELQGVHSRYLQGELSDDELVEALDRLLAVEVEFDRAAPAPKPIKPALKKVVLPGSRKGWMDCPDCLSSIQLYASGEVIAACADCGWHPDT